MKINRALALTLAAVSAGASAQSSVTLFGIVDANMRYVKNSNLPSNISMNNSGLSSGRFGFRGVEDLGGGLKAGFWLESDVNADTGTMNANGKLFARRSTVSLMSNLGELRVGRDLTPASAHTYKYDPFGVIGVAGANVTSRIVSVAPTSATYYRVDNMVQYFTPNFGGLQAEVAFAPDENAANNTGRHAAARIAYDNGPVSVSLSYGTTNVNAASAKFKQLGLGVAYNFGVARLLAFYQRDDLPFGTYGTVVAGAEDKILLGVTVPIGAHQIRASYVRTDSRKGSSAFNSSDANKYAIGYVHNLSMRTALYGTATRVSNKGGANFSLSGGAPGLAAGGSSTGMEVGIKHSF